MKNGSIMGALMMLLIDLCHQMKSTLW